MKQLDHVQNKTTQFLIMYAIRFKLLETDINLYNFLDPKHHVEGGWSQR